MTERKALKLALEALKGYRRELNDNQPCDAEQDIKKLLAQPKQEPVIGTKTWFEDGKVVTQHLTAKDIYKDPEQLEQEQSGFFSREAMREHSDFHVAQPEQEPVAWYHQEEYKTHFTSIPSQDMIENGYWQPLYATPPQRTWVGLTDEDKQNAFDDTQEGGGFWEFADAIEAKLKEKNT